MTFEFATATRIVFGAGALREAGPAARTFGRRAFVVTGRDPGRAAPLLAELQAAGVAATVFALAGEPTTDAVMAATAQARAADCELVVGCGGGSALDAAKAVSALLTNPGDLLDYLEVIGRAQPLSRPAAPCLAIPTTAGTGAEVTRNAVLLSPGHRLKVSLRSPLLLPRLALVDPALTQGLPPALTASTGLDALTQLIEPYVSCRANPLTDGICVEGLRRAARGLRAAFHRGGDAAARKDMALASLFGGLALANAGLGAVHGFAAPIGGTFAAPHGAVCAALLAPVMATNLAAARARQPDAGTLRRYTDVARLLTQDPDADAEAGVRWVRTLVAELRIPPLGAYGITANHVDPIVAQAARASSMKANPLPLTAAELAGALRQAL
ncbi:MAG TPA: iron-containing alcohol dehydrogenase [Opitutaceae bacterium]|nr:iron-containing alcohol dehydrogenase [Opitutaceae bacterium]